MNPHTVEVLSTALDARMEAAYDHAVKHRKHLWVLTMAFKASDDMAKVVARSGVIENFQVDHENVLTASGIGCFVCELTAPVAYGRPCPGEPDAHDDLGRPGWFQVPQGWEDVPQVEDDQ